MQLEGAAGGPARGYAQGPAAALLEGAAATVTRLELSYWRHVVVCCLCFGRVRFCSALHANTCRIGYSNTPASLPKVFLASVSCS